MLHSDLVTPGHLSRSAVIYIRQSTPHQVISNQESRRLQYALKQRALDLGWYKGDILVIDSDQGITGSSAQGRDGFKDLAARVSLGQVGIILSTEVTRISRNCSDWYPLLDVCGYMSCLIADRDGIYDPGAANGRLLLGLKGQMSEMELHMIRSRLTAGLINKAERGELAPHTARWIGPGPKRNCTKRPQSGSSKPSRVDLCHLSSGEVRLQGAASFQKSSTARSQKRPFRRRRLEKSFRLRYNNNP